MRAQRLDRPSSAQAIRQRQPDMQPEAVAELSDSAVPSTFESSPSKSVADFPSKESVGLPTSAATSELEAKLRQRMLKCEGRDVLYKPQAAKSLEKGPAWAPARLKQTILKNYSEMRDPSKVDELEKTASYQRCTKARAQSAHSLTRSKKKAAGAGSAQPGFQKPKRPHSVNEARDSPRRESSHHREESPDEAGELLTGVRGREPAAVGSAPGRQQEMRTSPTPRTPQSPHSEPLLTPRSDGGTSGVGSTFGSVPSEYEFFEPPEVQNPSACTTFALDDPMRDAREEAGDDAGSTRTIVSEKPCESSDGAAPCDLSVEECLFDLVNHIPANLAQKIGGVLQHLERVKQEGIMDQWPLQGEEGQWDAAGLVEGEGTGKSAADQAEATPSPCGSTSGWSFYPEPSCSKCVEWQSHFENQQHFFRATERQLEEASRREAAAMDREAEVLSEELSESHREESHLEQSKYSATLQATEQHCSRLQVEVRAAEAGLAELHARVADMDAQWLASEQQRQHFREQAAESVRVQARLQAEVARMSALNGEAQATATQMQTEAAALSELAVVQARFEEGDRGRERLQEEAQRAKGTRLRLEAEVACLAARHETAQAQLEILASRRTAQAEAESRSFAEEVDELRAHVGRLHGATAEAVGLRSALAVERSKRLQMERSVEAREQELCAALGQASAEVQELLRRAEAADASLECSDANGGALASDVTVVVAERDALRRDLALEHEFQQEERARGAALSSRNEELRECQEKLRAQLEAQAFVEEPERPDGRLVEQQEELLECQDQARALQEQRDAMLAEVQALHGRLEEANARLQWEKTQEDALASELLTVSREHETLQQDLTLERTKVQEEHERCQRLCSEVRTIEANMEAFAQRLMTVCGECEEEKDDEDTNAELDVFCGALLSEKDTEDEGNLNLELGRLRQALLNQQADLCAAMEEDDPGGQEDVLTSNGWPRVLRPCRAGDAQALHKELQAEHEHLTDRTQRVLHLQEVSDMEELKLAMDARAAAQVTELKEAEVRREQLEAETSLMAVEVATLSKDLGGRLLEDGSAGLTRRPFTIHDFLRAASRSPPNTQAAPCAGMGHSIREGASLEEQRQQGKRDSYLINLYLRWLRRGPYRHRLSCSGDTWYFKRPDYLIDPVLSPSNPISLVSSQHTALLGSGLAQGRVPPRARSGPFPPPLPVPRGARHAEDARPAPTHNPAAHPHYLL